MDFSIDAFRSVLDSTTSSPPAEGRTRTKNGLELTILSHIGTPSCPPVVSNTGRQQTPDETYETQETRRYHHGLKRVSLSHLPFSQDVVERHTNFILSGAQFGDKMVTFIVGQGKKRLAMHKDVLTAFAYYLFWLLCASDSTDVDYADLPMEREETFRAFMRWIYSAYMGITLSLLPSDEVDRFHLYAFAHKYHVDKLADAIVSALYEKFATACDLWYTLGSDKSALETFAKVAPSHTHLYRLVVRSLAYSICLRSKVHWFRPDGQPGYLTRPRTSATESDVEKVLGSIPRELCGPIFKEILLIKTQGAWRQGFDSIVGSESMFLKRYEDLGGVGPSLTQGSTAL